jgi:major membrane immunogen (membrane-anchored lipoprotein)
MKDIEIVEGKTISNKEFRTIMQTVLELLNSDEDGKDKAIKYVKTLIEENK